MLKIEYIKASELTPNPNNAKLHPEAQVAQIMRSIKEYGMDDPIAVWGEDNMIIEGHGRLLACEKLGIEEVPIIRLDHLTDKQRRAYTLIHNQLTMNSGFDVQKLTAELEAIGDNLIEYGFDIKPFQGIIEDEPAGVEEETFSEQGKCYRLGDHLIYCGSFEDAAVADMFAKEKATCTFTDPPYNVAVKNRSTGKTIQNDNMAHDEFQNFLNEAMTIIHAYTIPGGGVISWMSDTELTTLARSSAGLRASSRSAATIFSRPKRWLSTGWARVSSMRARETRPATLRSPVTVAVRVASLPIRASSRTCGFSTSHAPTRTTRQ